MENLIYKKIPVIMWKIGVIGKDRTNKIQNYQFRWIDDMYNALNQHLTEEKVFFTSEILSTEREERESKNGGTLIYSVITMKFTAYAEDWSNVSSTTVGEAMDSWDKSMNKAMSTAYKYALMQIFCIPTEDDKDTENSSPEPKPKAKTQTVDTPTGGTTTRTMTSKNEFCPECWEECKTKSGTTKEWKPYEMWTCNPCKIRFFVNRKPDLSEQPF